MSSKSNKQNKGRKRKRMPPKNRNTKNLFEVETNVVNVQLECSSAKKLQANDVGDDYELDNIYRLLYPVQLFHFEKFHYPYVSLSGMS